MTHISGDMPRPLADADRTRGGVAQTVDVVAPLVGVFQPCEYCTRAGNKDPRRAPRRVDTLGPEETDAVWLSLSRGLIWSWRATGWHWRDAARWIPSHSDEAIMRGPFVELRDWTEPEPTR